MRVVLSFLLFGSLLSAGLKPVHLECEARTNPLGIDTPRPRLSWILESADNGQRQLAYRILVASRPELLRPGQADLWDSGEVSSAETLNLEYAGHALASDQRCFWQVQVRDRTGEWTTSETAEWTMGLLAPSDWHASWIGIDNGPLVSGPLPLFRKEFEVQRPLRRAVLHVAGLGQHEVTLNGAPVSDHLFAPAWSDYYKRIYYETFDVTALLKTGANAAGVMLGNGMYNVVGGRYTKFTASFGPPKLIFLLTLEYADGSAARIVSDPSWRTAPGPVTFSCIYGGEDYDARLEQPGWDRPGFDDSKWAHAARLEGPGGRLAAQFSPPVRVQQSYDTVKVTAVKPGVWIYDLGHNFSGRPLLKVSGAAGQKVRMKTAELLNSQGLVNQSAVGEPVWFEYTLKGGGTETWTPRFSYTGFRYVQVEGLKPRRDQGQFLHATAARTGQFTSSSDLLNRIHELIVQAIRSNLQNVLTDCPHREKLGWLEQAHLMAAGLCYNFDLRNVYAKIAADTRDAQLAERPGARHRAGVRCLRRRLPRFAGVGLDRGARAVARLDLVRRPASAGGVLRDHPALPRLSGREFAARHPDVRPGRLVRHRPGRAGRVEAHAQGITATAVYYQDLMAAAGAAHLLGNIEAEWSCHQRADAVRAEFLRRYYDAEQKTFEGASQTANAMPLVVGLAPDADRAALVERIAADVRQRGNHTSAGDIGYHYVLSALAEGGRSDVIYAMATAPDAPSYASQLARGATALTEAWDANPNVSQNHFMLGHIEEWLYRYLAGIAPAPDAVGASAWRKVILQPHPVGDLQSAGATYDSPRGRISCRWQRNGNDIVIDATLPPGVTAELRQPDLTVRATLDSGTHHLTFTDFH